MFVLLLLSYCVVRIVRNSLVDLDNVDIDIGHGLVDIDIASNHWIGSNMLAPTSIPFWPIRIRMPIRNTSDAKSNFVTIGRFKQ